MITIGTLGKTLQKHTKNKKQTNRRRLKSIYYEEKKNVEKLSIDDRV